MTTAVPADDPRLQSAVSGDDAVLEQLPRGSGSRVTAELSIAPR